MANRRDFLKMGAGLTATSLAAGAGALPSAKSHKAAGSKPNIIFILADDMGYSDIGCFGSEIETPNLDKLAARGIRLNQFYNNPRCCPSRASIMTGLYAQQAHMGNMVVDHGRYPFPEYDGILAENTVTIAEALKTAGYNTAAVGKWHLATETEEGKRSWPLQRGFDKFWGMIAGASVYYESPHLMSGNDRLPPPPKDQYLTDIWADHAVEFVNTLSKDKKPFFLYTAFNAPHWPIQAPEETVLKYANRYGEGWDKLREARHKKQLDSGLLPAKWPLTQRDARVPAWDVAEDKDWEMRRMAVYAAMIDRLDQGIGRIIDAVEKAGVLENTLIIFMSDNGGNAEEIARGRLQHSAANGEGEENHNATPPSSLWPCQINMTCAGNIPGIMPGGEDTFQSIGIPWGNVTNTPFRLYKHYAHEGGISTPFVASWPAYIKRQHAPISGVGHETDLMPTFLELAGVTYPSRIATGPIPELAGQSLVPLFSGLPRTRKPIFWEHEGNKAVRDGKWKLVSRFPDQWELFDIEADRTELHDLAAAQTGTHKSDGCNVGRMGETRRSAAMADASDPAPRTNRRTRRPAISTEVSTHYGRAVQALASGHHASSSPQEFSVSKRFSHSSRRSFLASVTALSALCATPRRLFASVGDALSVQDRWQRKKSPLMTKWSDSVDPAQPLPEYPRPQFVRKAWLNLNGIWEFQRGKDSSEAVPVGKILSSSILLPYPAESALSGVMEHYDRLWYRRSFSVPKNWGERQVLLHFGAVDYESEVFINGHSVGIHRGGYDPFSYDVSAHLLPDTENELIVRVFDPTETGGQPRGKQNTNPRGITYTPTTGIWQTVWLEPVHRSHIASFTAIPDIDEQLVSLHLDLSEAAQTAELEVVIHSASGVRQKLSAPANQPLKVPIREPQLWSPDYPRLYSLKLRLKLNGKTVDSVNSYFAMRKTSVGDVNGSKKLLLNNEFVFQLGPLDQGFWPDGIYTAPTDEALKSDIVQMKAMGFNMVRKHIKVEPARWYYWADQLGLMVWQDAPSCNSYPGRAFTPPPVDEEAFEEGLRNMVIALRNAPSIVLWTVFNEGQGQFDTERLVSVVRDLDQSRPVNEASGGEIKGSGDMDDIHSYPEPTVRPQNHRQANICGEFGGIGYLIPERSWQPNGHGYVEAATPEDLLYLYAEYIAAVRELRDASNLSAAVYTEHHRCDDRSKWPADL